ncbi:hypothetical protein [Aneurinibacillus terranovensis]|uniref:hypothetical protein n=1 Tax=Aneurinibacillus terranovensis TaxID=278991 RepID=UPI0003FA818D|nr:hypothetical protein [Aneurinibacillus terranovensis]
MSEKNILAFFKSPEEAEKVAEQLKSLGTADMQIDRISRYTGEGVERFTNPITGNISSLANLTLAADGTTRNEGILMAADVSASGMSDGGQDDVTGRDVLLTVVIDESNHKKALQLIEQGGGMV